MCGIIAVLRARDDRPSADIEPIIDSLLRAESQLAEVTDDLSTLVDRLPVWSAALSVVDSVLRSLPGVRAMVEDPAGAMSIGSAIEGVGLQAERLEAALDLLEVADVGFDLERVNASMIELKDGIWAIEHDRLRVGAAVRDLGGGQPEAAAIGGLWSIQTALSAIDRLEVRGRDSAGLQVFVSGHGLDVSSFEHGQASERVDDVVCRAGAMRVVGDGVAFLYKMAAEIGELGDNSAALRRQIKADELLRKALSNPGSHAVVLGHTRWASIGIISETNAHPLDSYEVEACDGPYVASVLNGDVDNFADLKTEHQLEIAPEITTDAKVIPTLVSRSLAGGDGLLEAFQHTVASFEGSVAIATHSAAHPEALALALRGSGQALYIGLADGAFVVGSEPYGVVEEAVSYVRMDGETPADLGNPIASQGQVVILDGRRAGEISGIQRVGYDGTSLPVTESDVVQPEITTRDIDRGDAAHFLLKEIGEAPQSFRKTLRGRIADGPSGPRVELGFDALPESIRIALAAGRIRRVVAIGQGTAAVAGRSIPHFLAPMLDRAGIAVSAQLATELSGFGMTLDMSDTLVVAVSQSGTTTDTNRTVDLVRARGGHVVAIVNRRGSDLTDKADGVLYTSDGRDVEMSVASTKAFYAQVAAGVLLSLAIAEAAGVAPDHGPITAALRAMPDAMTEVLATREAIAEAAKRHAPSKRYWALVGNGANRIAAMEIRIKLSELCYKAIPEDGTEDKKHIDLSSEPMILVCAAGLTGSTADDVAKEVAIYRAHKATPVVVASKGDTRFAAAAELLTVPAVHPDLDFLLATMVGHLFGYEAALAIDAQAFPLREMRSVIESAVATGSLPEGAFEELNEGLRAPAGRFLDGLRAGSYDGNLEASTAARLVSVLRYAVGTAALETYQVELGKVGRPGVVIEDLTVALSRAIDELTRPIDAIKHQAKTVTVGISRSDETLLQSELVRAAMAAGAPRDRLSYRALRTLVALDAAVIDVIGFTRYRIEGDVENEATIQVLDRGGIARDLASRTETNPILRGTKHRAAFEREVMVGRGRDGRSVIHIPEVKDAQTTGLTLLHCRFHEVMAPAGIRGVMQGYRGRYGALKDAVTETEPAFRDDILGSIDVVALLTQPVYVLAERWST